MTHRKFFGLATLVALLLTLSTSAAADNIGAQGRVLVVKINTTASDEYGVEHGAMVVGDAISGVQTYRWGGSRCPAAEINDDLAAMLQRALDNSRILIEPRWKPGQGGFQCLVSFVMFLRSEQGLTLP